MTKLPEHLAESANSSYAVARQMCGEYPEGKVLDERVDVDLSKPPCHHDMRRPDVVGYVCLARKKLQMSREAATISAPKTEIRHTMRLPPPGPGTNGLSNR